MRSARMRAAGLAAVLLTGTLSAAACGENTSANGAGRVTLKIGLFGTFGYREAGLYDAYMKLHPNITIVEDDVEAETKYFSTLQTHLADGSGLDDVQGIEVGRIAEVDQNLSTKFVDLRTLGADALKDTFFASKWAAATTADGKVMGLGTDYGPLAICYRTDLFKFAGLPTDSAAVSALWPDWDGYVRAGLRYKAKAPADHSWADSGGGMFNAILGQSATMFYDASGKPVVATNPAVRKAWDLAMQLSTQGLTAKLDQFSNPWNQAFTTGSFATLACPAWMVGYIKGQAAAMSGLWSVAKIPGRGGNWGGSYLSIPKASQHPKEAYDLAAWLTAPAQQLTMFAKAGNFPSSSVAARDPSIASKTDPYFGTAPVGRIFAAAAAVTSAQVLGPKDGSIKDSFTKGGILRVETQGMSPDASWARVLSDVAAITGG